MIRLLTTFMLFSDFGFVYGLVFEISFCETSISFQITCLLYDEFGASHGESTWVVEIIRIF